MKHRSTVSNVWRNAELSFGNLCAFVREHRHQYNAALKHKREPGDDMLRAAVFELDRLIAMAKEEGEL